MEIYTHGKDKGILEIKKRRDLTTSSYRNNYQFRLDTNEAKIILHDVSGNSLQFIRKNTSTIDSSASIPLARGVGSAMTKKRKTIYV